MPKELESLRRKIDAVDDKIVKNLAARFKITHAVGVYKAEHHLPALNKDREAQIYKAKRGLAKELDLNEELIEKVFKMIIATVRKDHAVLARSYKARERKK